jgi:hypothetical protein
MSNQPFRKIGARLRGVPLWAWEVSICASLTLPLLSAVATFHPPLLA